MSSDYPLYSELKEKLQGTLFSFLSVSMDELEQKYGARYIGEFEGVLHLIQQAFGEHAWPSWVVKGIIGFNKSVLHEEKYFMDNKQYRKKIEDYNEIKLEYLSSSDIMEGHYLIGLMLTYYMWPHHYQLLRFMSDQFLVSSAKVDDIMEWGVGHGLLSLKAHQVWPLAHNDIYDVSEHSIAFSSKVLKAAGFDSKAAFHLEDITEFSPSELPKVDRLICCELLEHVPYPEKILERMEMCLNESGRAFVTAAINAPQPDHIYLFKSADEVHQMIQKHNLNVLCSTPLIHPNRMNEETPPTVLAMCVGKA